jgi:hypothetical protein
MGTVNVKKSTTDSSIILFDKFYKKEIQVDSADYDIVRAYFRSIYQDPLIADDFTAVIFQIAQGYNRDIHELLEEFKGQDGVTVTSTLAYYLNGLRSKATLIGVTAIQQPNIYAARNVQV